MNTENLELQRLAAMELSGLTAASIGTDFRFTRLMHIDERIVARYNFFYAGVRQKEIDRAQRGIEKRLKLQKDFEPFVFAFAYPGQKPGIDETLLSMARGGITVIDATAAPMIQECNEKYAFHMAAFNQAGGKKNQEGREYLDRAYEALRPWTDRLISYPVTVYNGEHPEGFAFDTLQHFFDRVLRDICETYPVSPDTMDLDQFFYWIHTARFRVSDGYYGQRISLWDGVTDPDRTPDRLFAFAWGDDSAWDDPRYAGEKIVMLKKAFDAYLEDRLAKGEKVSFTGIFEAMRKPPYGLIPNIIGAILMGMFFRTWRNRNLIWTNGFQQDVLDDAHLLSMVENGIHNQRSFYPNALTDYIMLPDQEMAVFREAACEIFSLDREKVCFLPELRAEIRHAMEGLPYPIVSALYADIGETDRETVERLIRFVRQTSDHAGGEDGSEPANSLCASFSADGGLPARIRICLHGEPLREGFLRMLKKNRLNSADLRQEMLEELCCGHREWKWIWQEESVIHAIQGV